MQKSTYLTKLSLVGLSALLISSCAQNSSVNQSPVSLQPNQPAVVVDQPNPSLIPEQTDFAKNTKLYKLTNKQLNKSLNACIYNDRLEKVQPVKGLIIYSAALPKNKYYVHQVTLGSNQKFFTQKIKARANSRIDYSYEIVGVVESVTDKQGFFKFKSLTHGNTGYFNLNNQGCK